MPSKLTTRLRPFWRLLAMPIKPPVGWPSKPARMHFLAMLSIALLCAGCATQKPRLSCPAGVIPTPPPELMEPQASDFVDRIERLLYQ